MTNYEAILKMIPERMACFLDQVYLTGLNTGMYAVSHNDDHVLDENPFNSAWLSDQAEAATAFGDDYLLNALVEAVLTSAMNPDAGNFASTDNTL